MDRCHLKVEEGDRLHMVPCVAGDNIKWLLRMITKKGVIFLHHFYVRPCQVARIQPKWQQAWQQLVQIGSAGSNRFVVT